MRAKSRTELPLAEAAELLGWTALELKRQIKRGTLRSGQPGSVLWQDVRELARGSQRLPSITTDVQLSAAEVPEELLIRNGQPGPAATFKFDRVAIGDCMHWMRKMPAHSVQCVVTSPPYWGVRRYADDQTAKWSDGTTTAFGQEKRPEDYVRHTLEILRMLRRVVKVDGVVWWNIGDTYMTRSHVRSGSGERLDALEGRRARESWKNYPVRRYSAGHPYLKDKDLTLIPFQIALGAQRIGWYVRSVITWSKPNTLPEPVRDRPTVSHEYILMLTQDRFYKYSRRGASEAAISDWTLPEVEPTGRRNSRTVWTFGTSTGRGNHVAAFPLELPLRCIAASTDPNDVVFDPFAGSATTLIAAKQTGRRYFGCDISPTYVDEARKRLANTPRAVAGKLFA